MNVNASAPTTDVTTPNWHENITAIAMITPISSQTAKAASNNRGMNWPYSNRPMPIVATANAAITTPITANIPSHVPATYCQRRTSRAMTLNSVRFSTSTGIRVVESASATTSAAEYISAIETSRNTAETTPTP